MEKEQKEEEEHPASIMKERDEEKDFSFETEESWNPFPSTVTSRVLYMLGDITSGPAHRFAQWLELVRKSIGRYHSSGFPNRPNGLSSPMSLSTGEPVFDPKSTPSCEQSTGTSLCERFGKAAMLDVESGSLSWDMLSSLHHMKHKSSTENSWDKLNRTLEVTVNSGGVVFFALFNRSGLTDAFSREAAAVVKISSSRMATQSERLGYEFAKWLGVRTPQIKEAAEKARDVAISEGDEVGEMTCSELLEALEFSRCLFLMNYIHGSPLLESSSAFDNRDAAERTATALGRILLLDLVIRNEDRLPCRLLRWRGNSANLLLADEMSSTNVDVLEEAFDSEMNRFRPGVFSSFQKERRAISVDSRLNPHDPGLVSQIFNIYDVTDSPKSSVTSLQSQVSIDSIIEHIVAIDSGVPRRPPAGKRANDQAIYPKLVELLLNSFEFSSDILHDISGGRLGSPSEDRDCSSNMPVSEIKSVVQKFRSEFRAALRDLQGFHIFLLTLNQKLENLLRAFFNIIDRNSLPDLDKDDLAIPESPTQSAGGGGPYPSPPNKEIPNSDIHSEYSDTELQKSASRSSSGPKESSDSSSSATREGWSGKFYKGCGEPLHSLRLTSKLRDFHKLAKVDAELNKELDQWNEMLKSEAVKLCQDNNFNTGFFEGSDSNCVVDAYELKVRLEHILERISLISDAANTEKPSPDTGSLFIGGALAARSVYTLQHLGITHILCLCSNEIGQSDSQHPELFEYENFSIFEKGCNFIDRVEETEGKILVHCFEGRSRSATLVIAYLMLRKNFTLLQAWSTLKRVHRRAQPNDGFAKVLLELDRKLHGRVSMEWQQRKPIMKVCPICGKNADLSSSSLKLHLQKSHKKFSSGSVDSAMTMEIQKFIQVLGKEDERSRKGNVTDDQTKQVKQLKKEEWHEDVANCFQSSSTVQSSSGRCHLAPKSFTDASALNGISASRGKLLKLISHRQK